MSRYIPKEVKEAVQRRANNRCELCKGYSDHYEYDHLNPYSIGGKATVDNIQYLCRKCNNEKRDKMPPCAYCGHWIAYKAIHCQTCGRKQPTVISNYDMKPSSNFFTFKRVLGLGLIGFVFLLLFVPGCSVVFYKLLGRQTTTQTSSQAQGEQIINQILSIPNGKHQPIKFVVQNGRGSGFLTGGFKVTQGSKIDFAILSDADYQNFLNTGSLNGFIYISNRKLNQPLPAGSYNIVFNNAENVVKEVGAELYVEYR